jgi:hypothetical protein
VLVTVQHANVLVSEHVADLDSERGAENNGFGSKPSQPLVVIARAANTGSPHAGTAASSSGAGTTG